MKFEPCWNEVYRGFFITVWGLNLDLVYTTRFFRERGW